MIQRVDLQWQYSMLSKDLVKKNAAQDQTHVPKSGDSKTCLTSKNIFTSPKNGRFSIFAI